MSPCPSMFGCAIGFALLAVACEPDRRFQARSPAAQATIGPAGGELEVMSGEQAGLRITVPPGAVSRDVRFRVVEADHAPSLLPPSYPPLAHPFVIEPTDLFLDVPAVLRLPYDPTVVTTSPPGHLMVVQSRPGSSVGHPPEAVDTAAGRVQVSLRTFGRLEVVRGGVSGGLFQYLGPSEATVALADGWTFTSRPVAEASPFAQGGARQWRLTGPGVDESWFFHQMLLVGREAPAWRETWDEPVQPWSDASIGEPRSTIVGTEVSAPIGAPPLGGTIALYHAWSWDLPRAVGGQLVTDVARLELNLAWERADLGTGQRQHVFWFAPEHGLLAIAIDGIVHERAAP